MSTQFVAVVLSIASFEAGGSGNRNSQNARANESQRQRKTAPAVETKASATPESVVDSGSIGDIPRAWKPALQTSGGIAGLGGGAGNLTVESSGKDVFEGRVRPIGQIKTCRADLTAKKDAEFAKSACRKAHAR